jgi:hypothetical protein
VAQGEDRIDTHRPTGGRMTSEERDDYQNRGVTAAFNRNLLVRMRFESHFEPWDSRIGSVNRLRGYRGEEIHQVAIGIL